MPQSSSFFAKDDTLKTVTDFICGRPNSPETKSQKYKRDYHQRCISADVITKMAKKLSNIDEQQFASFEDLWKHVSIHRIKGFSDLCVYDFCLRYGINRNIYPLKKVYLHAGAMKGAKSLYRMGLLKSKPQNQSIDIDHFPPDFEVFDSMNIENFLCVKHRQLQKLEKAMSTK